MISCDYTDYMSLDVITFKYTYILAIHDESNDMGPRSKKAVLH